MMKSWRRSGRRVSAERNAPRCALENLQGTARVVSSTGTDEMCSIGTRENFFARFSANGRK